MNLTERRVAAGALAILVGGMVLFSGLRQEPKAPPAIPEVVAAVGGHADVRSGRWPAVEKEHLRREPVCAVCGHTGKGLQVHHIHAFSWPGGADLELDDGADGTGRDGNLITLCSGPETHNCHLLWGHLGDYKSENIDIRKDAAWFRNKIKNRPYKPK